MKCKLCNTGLFWRIALGLYFIALGYLCFSNSENLPPHPGFLNFNNSDKLVHFLMFAPYPWIVCLSLGKGLSRPSRRTLLLILVSGLVLGTATELIQGLLPQRDKELLDFAADSAAIVLNCLLLGFLPQVPPESSCGTRDCSGCRN